MGNSGTMVFITMFVSNIPASRSKPRALFQMEKSVVRRKHDLATKT